MSDQVKPIADSELLGKLYRERIMLLRDIYRHDNQSVTEGSIRKRAGPDGWSLYSDTDSQSQGQAAVPLQAKDDIKTQEDLVAIAKRALL